MLQVIPAHFLFLSRFSRTLLNLKKGETYPALGRADVDVLHQFAIDLWLEELAARGVSCSFRIRRQIEHGREEAFSCNDSTSIPVAWRQIICIIEQLRKIKKGIRHLFIIGMKREKEHSWLLIGHKDESGQDKGPMRILFSCFKNTFLFKGTLSFVQLLLFSRQQLALGASSNNNKSWTLPHAPDHHLWASGHQHL